MTSALVLYLLFLTLQKIAPVTVVNAFVSCGISYMRNKCEFKKRLMDVLDGVELHNKFISKRFLMNLCVIKMETEELRYAN